MVNQLGKFMDSYLRPLSRTIGREDPETGDIQSIKKMMIKITEEFPSPFGSSAM